MEKKELIEKVCYALRSYIAELEYPDPEYGSNEAYRHALNRAQEIREYILELKKL